MISKQEAPYPLRGLVELAYSKNGPVRLFMVHGISRHVVGWGETSYLDNFLTDSSAREHGWTLTISTPAQPIRWKEAAPKGSSSGSPNQIDYPSMDFAGLLQVYTVTDKDGKTCLVAYEITWSPLTNPYKDWRFKNGNNSGFDDEAHYRPLINGVVRNVLDENLSDAVLYARGFDNNIIGKTVSHALESFYVGEFDPGQDAASRQNRHLAPTIFLTESLGSIILAETITGHVKRPSATQSTAQRNGMRDVLRNLETVYMMANQLALLDMPTPDPTGNIVPSSNPSSASMTAESTEAHGAFHAFVDARNSLLAERGGTLLAPGPTPAPARPLQVAAFSDLYDVLSYRVSEDSFPKGGARIDNFYPRNATAWVGLYEDIAKAHTGYGANPDVIRLVMKGYTVP
jgi:hypothetical protein